MSLTWNDLYGVLCGTKTYSNNGEILVYIVRGTSSGSIFDMRIDSDLNQTDDDEKKVLAVSSLLC